MTQNEPELNSHASGQTPTQGVGAEKCYITTLFNSDNCGAFLQGMALGRLLEERHGLDVSFVDTGARSPRRTFYRSCKQALKHLSLSRYRFARDKCRNFEACIADLDVVTPSECKEGALYVFGSDEIWNLSTPRVTDFPMLWGEGLPKGYRVAYAPSASDADPSLLFDNETFLKNVFDYKYVSARDRATQAAAQRALGREVPVVCDPTLLFDADFYGRFEEKASLRDYLLVYAYEITEAEAAEVKAFARSAGLTVVSASILNPWADVNLPCGSYGFLGLFRDAACVVTDTFHGSVFSSIYRKPFAAYGRRRTKLLDFLESYGLSSRFVRVGGLSKVLAAGCDWVPYEAALADARARSLSYIDTFVEDYGNSLA